MQGHELGDGRWWVDLVVEGNITINEGRLTYTWKSLSESFV